MTFAFGGKLLSHIPELVDPAALPRHPRPNHVQGGMQARTAIGDDKPQDFPFQPSLIEVVTEFRPTSLGFRFLNHEINEFSSAFQINTVADQYKTFLGPENIPAFEDSPRVIKKESCRQN